MKKITPKTILIIVAIIAFLALVGFGTFYLVVNFNRQNVSDVNKIKDFAQIQKLMDEHYKANKKLVANLSELNFATATNYTYQITGEGIYKLCTTFNADVTQEVITESGISVNYKQGYDCVVFNSAATANPDGLVVLKKINDLQKLEATFSSNKTEGVTLANMNYSFDPKQSKLYKDKTTGDYLINLFLTITSQDICQSDSANNKDKCCYTWQNVSGKSTNDVKLIHNRLGSADYIQPSAKDEKDTFGDLPMSFCLSGTKLISGGSSFIIPAKAITSNNGNFSFFFNGDENSEGLQVSVKTK